MNDENNIINLRYLSGVTYLGLIISIYFMIFTNSTILYHTSAMYLIAILIFLLLLMKNVHIYRLNFLKVNWLLVSSFSILNIFYSKNPLLSMECVIFLLISISILEIDFEIIFFEVLFSKIVPITILLAITIFLNAFIKDLMTNYLSFLVVPSSLDLLYIEVSQGIYSGILAEKANAAVAMVLGIGAVFAKFLTNEKFKVKHVLLLGAYLIAIFLTGKRSLTLIPIAACMFIFFVHRGKAKYRKLIILILVSIILCYIAITFIPQTQIIIERLLLVTDSGTIDTSGRDTALWPAAMEMYETNKLFGYGLNTFNNYFTTYGTWGVWNAYAHNTYIGLLAETGIVGTILFCMAFSISLIKAIYLFTNKQKILEKKHKELLIFALFIELFWLAYGMTGNPFYNPGQFLIYVLCISMVSSIEKLYRV